MAVVPMDRGTLWQWLAGFSAKTNQERENYIATQLFPTAGIEDVHLQRVLYGGAWGEQYGNWDNLHNVIGLRRGTLPVDQRKTIAIGAHFDKVTYPGRSANPGFSDGILDNATGVALIASLAQAISRPFNDIKFVAFASEEPPPYFNGSRLYFSEAENTAGVLCYLNFDVLGRGNMAIITGSANQELADIALGVAKETGVPLVWRPSSTNTASDDLMAQAAGLRVLAFACDGYDRLDIHVPEDNLSAVDQDAYYQHYVLALKILAYLDAWYAEP
jgi:Zn-dependent M28 family amino/carboxypeptidase